MSDQNPLTALLAGIQTGPPSMPGIVDTVGIDDASISSREFSIYKLGEKGNSDRLTILMPTAVKVARTHYIKDKGYFLCTSTFVSENGFERKTKEDICCQMTKSEPRRRCGALVIHWGTDKAGRVVRIQAAEGQFPVAFEFKLWRFGEGMFDNLRTVNSEFPLTANDVLVTCEDQTYQRGRVTPTNGSLAVTNEYIAMAGQGLKSWLEAKSAKVASELGRRLNQQEWVDMMRGAASVPGLGGGNTAAAASDAPPQSIVDLLANT